MTYKQKPPTLTHQPGLPADSASRTKAGGSPEDQPTSLYENLTKCSLTIGPAPEIGGLVWMWQVWAEKWQVYQVLERYESRGLLGPRWMILDLETGDKRLMPTNKLHMPRE